MQHARVGLVSLPTLADPVARCRSIRHDTAQCIFPEGKPLPVAGAPHCPPALMWCVLLGGATNGRSSPAATVGARCSRTRNGRRRSNSGGTLPLLFSESLPRSTDRCAAIQRRLANIGWQGCRWECWHARQGWGQCHSFFCGRTTHMHPCARATRPSCQTSSTCWLNL